MLKLNNNENISYPVEFYIINDNIYNKFKSINSLINIFDRFEIQKMIINNGQIILAYKNKSLKKDNNILITNYNNDSFIPDILLFFNKQEDLENFFKIQIVCKNNKYNIKTKEREIEINGNKVGEIYKLMECKAENKVYNNNLKEHQKEENKVINKENIPSQGNTKKGATRTIV